MRGMEERKNRTREGERKRRKLCDRKQPFVKTASSISGSFLPLFTPSFTPSCLLQGNSTLFLPFFFLFFFSLSLSHKTTLSVLLDSFFSNSLGSSFHSHFSPFILCFSIFLPLSSIYLKDSAAAVCNLNKERKRKKT